MVDSICGFLINRMRKEMPEIDDERAEVIKYGLENLIRGVTKSNFTFCNSGIAWSIRLNTNCICISTSL